MSAASVVVLDHGSGNLRSVQRALLRAGAQVRVTADRDAAAAADGLVVPGVGAFAACMAGLDAIDAPALVRDRLAADRPVLGICVGMQVMFARGAEHGVVTDGIGVLPGEVRRLRADRVPHMGWNTVTAGAGSRLFDGVAERYYFVHSYGADAAGLPTEAVVSTVEHGGDTVVAAVEHGALVATQFHPEKSGDAGAALLAAWVGALAPGGGRG